MPLLHRIRSHMHILGGWFRAHPGLTWVLFTAWVFLFRLPHIIHADSRFDGDSALHWLVMEYNLEGKGPYLHPFASDHLGITEFLLALPFVPLAGHTALAYQLGLALVFLIVSAGVYALTRTFYGLRTAQYALLLLMLPPPFLSFYTTRPFGGHFLSIGMMLITAAWCIRLQRDSRSILHWFLPGILAGLSFYTNRMAGLVIAALLSWIALSDYARGNWRGLWRLPVFAAGLLPAGLLLAIGAANQPMPIGYTAPFKFSLDNVAVNARAILTTLLPAALDGSYIPGIDAGGFRPDSGLRSILSFWNSVVLGIAIAPAVVVLRSIVRVLLRKADPAPGSFFALVVAANLAAVLLTSIPMSAAQMIQDPFLRAIFESQNTTVPIVVRYFIPIILTSLPFFALLASGVYVTPRVRGRVRQLKWKVTPLFLVMHFAIYSIAYARGYLPGAPIHTSEAASGAREVTAFLKQNSITGCIANFWLAYPVVYFSGRTIVANPVPWIPDLGLSREPNFERQLTVDPRGIQCLVQNRLILPRELQQGSRAALAVQYPSGPATVELRVLQRQAIQDWDVLLVEESPESIERRLRAFAKDRP